MHQSRKKKCHMAPSAQRGNKKRGMPILTCHRIFDSYVWPHQGVNGKTAAELCGLEVKGKKKWLTLVQNARDTQ